MSENYQIHTESSSKNESVSREIVEGNVDEAYENVLKEIEDDEKSYRKLKTEHRIISTRILNLKEEGYSEDDNDLVSAQAKRMILKNEITDMLMKMFKYLAHEHQLTTKLLDILGNAKNSENMSENQFKKIEKVKQNLLISGITEDSLIRINEAYKVRLELLETDMKIYSCKINEKLETNNVNLNIQGQILSDEKHVSGARQSKNVSMSLETPLSETIASTDISLTEDRSEKTFFSDSKQISTQNNSCGNVISSKARRDAATAALRLKISQKGELNTSSRKLESSPAGSFVSVKKNNSQISLRSPRELNVLGGHKISLTELLNNSAVKSSDIKTNHINPKSPNSYLITDANKRSRANIEFNRSY